MRFVSELASALCPQYAARASKPLAKGKLPSGPLVTFPKKWRQGSARTGCPHGQVRYVALAQADDEGHLASGGGPCRASDIAVAAPIETNRGPLRPAETFPPPALALTFGRGVVVRQVKHERAVRQQTSARPALPRPPFGRRQKGAHCVREALTGKWAAQRI